MSWIFGISLGAKAISKIVYFKGKSHMVHRCLKPQIFVYLLIFRIMVICSILSLRNSKVVHTIFIQHIVWPWWLKSDFSETIV